MNVQDLIDKLNRPLIVMRRYINDPNGDFSVKLSCEEAEYIINLLKNSERS